LLSEKRMDWAAHYNNPSYVLCTESKDFLAEVSGQTFSLPVLVSNFRLYDNYNLTV